MYYSVKYGFFLYVILIETNLNYKHFCFMKKKIQHLLPFSGQMFLVKLLQRSRDD